MRTIPGFFSNAIRSARRALLLVVPSLAVAACVVPVGEGEDEGEAVHIQAALEGICDTAVTCDPSLSVAPPPSTAPDLIGSPFHRGTAPAVTVVNSGTVASPPSSTLVDIGWGCRQHLPTPAIPAGSAIQVNVTLPNRCYRAGATMTIVVDEYQAVSESDETNNTRTQVLGSLGTPRR